MLYKQVPWSPPSIPELYEMIQTSEYVVIIITPCNNEFSIFFLFLTVFPSPKSKFDLDVLYFVLMTDAGSLFLLNYKIY